MRRIRFVVTGDLEQQAIVASLRRLFPQRDFDGEELRWLRPRKTHAATTHRLLDEDSPNSSMRGLAKAMMAEALDGSDGTPSDLVIAVDDLELHNFDQPEVVCRHFRRAVREEISRRCASADHAQRVREVLQQRCSFHLLCPMVESYLFGEQAALVRAGSDPMVDPALRSPDYEDFWVTDPAFLPHCSTENQAKQRQPHSFLWWQEERHAKHYLEHLVDAAGANYDETVGGVEAFKALAWEVLAAGPGSLSLVAALLEDLGDFCGVPNPLAVGTPSPLTYPGRTVRRDRLLLRNM